MNVDSMRIDLAPVLSCPDLVSPQVPVVLNAPSPSVRVPPQAQQGIERAQDALQFASHRGHYHTVALLLSRNSNVNLSSSEYCLTSLHLAAFSGHSDVVRLLLDRNADLHAKDSNAAQSLHYAALRGHVEVVEILIKRGADAQARTGDNRTASDLASGPSRSAIRALLSQPPIPAAGILN